MQRPFFLDLKKNNFYLAARIAKKKFMLQENIFLCHYT